MFKNKKRAPSPLLSVRSSLWYHLELNQGHTDFQSVALPTELWYRVLNRGCKYK